MSQTPPHGFRSAVAYAAQQKLWITVGPNGTDISTDDGRNWTPLKPSNQDPPDADKNWNALSLPYVVGPKGRIGKLRPINPPAEKQLAKMNKYIRVHPRKSVVNPTHCGVVVPVEPPAGGVEVGDVGEGEACEVPNPGVDPNPAAAVELAAATADEDEIRRQIRALAAFLDRVEIVSAG
mgnify:CR=1 FL=1